MATVYSGPMTNDGRISSIEKLIPSETSAGKRVIDELIVELEKLAWMEQDIFGIHLAVEEAVVNAIKHGNQNDRSKKVHISYEVTPSRLRIQIEDEGQGFNPDEVPDPTDDDNLELPSGRGLMLMRNFMTTVDFNERGNRVIMEKVKGEAD